MKPVGRLSVSLFTFVFIQIFALSAYSGPQFSNIEVNASKKAGKLKSLRGVNGSPKRPAFHREGTNYPAEDNSDGYRKARIDLIRTHGSRAWDLNTLFPDSSADAGLPQSYNFGPADEIIKSINEVGAETIFKIGEKADLPLILRDIEKYAEIIRHVVLHYNKRWANGFQYNIKYWEVWNEPDLATIHWDGTPEQFHQVYKTAAKAVKSADPAALIGGPTLAMVNEPTPYREGFLAFVRDNHIPLDFFSWHYYSVDANDPYDFVRLGRDIQELLNEYGFKNSLNILDEWNCDFREVQTMDPMVLAGFQVSALIYMEESDIDLAAMWFGVSPFGSLGSKPTKAAQGMIVTGQMAKTPEKLQITGLNTNGFAAQAGQSEDGKIVQVLISNYRVPEKYIGPRKEDILHEKNLFDMRLLPRRTVTYEANGGYNLVVKGLDPKGDYDIERYRLTGDRDFSLFDKSQAKGAQVRLQAVLPAPAVELIVIAKRSPGSK
jgi:xylan 1,4-beta-xylosidase